MSGRGDARWMDGALALAERGRGRTWPNPNVGCVVVAGGQVVGRGWTQPGGRPHAEAMALAQAGDRSRGATLYVTLEPCAHDSVRGPACADLIIAAGIARVVVALTDPDPRTDGSGVERLRSAGIDVLPGIGTHAAARSVAGFLTRQQRGRPHVTLKLALSLDGSIAMPDGSSRWITNDVSRRHAHVERARSDAILVGRGTLAADYPRLDVRLAALEERSPTRVLLSSGPAPDGWMAIDRPSAIAGLAADWLLVEGGAATASAFVTEDLVDTLVVYRAPILVGGKHALGHIGLADLASAHQRWSHVDGRMLGADRLDIYDRIRD